MSEEQDAKKEAMKDCWECQKKVVGHFHCDRCGASILHGEDPWYREPNEEVICNSCKVKEFQ